MSSAKLNKEEFHKQRDLDAARKAGTAPAELDEEGNEINPHIPHYIVSAPWYVQTGAPSLKHQRAPIRHPSEEITAWYARGSRPKAAAEKFRPGACVNCGAMTHSAKDCVERPRKKGARWTGRDIQADEVIQNFSFGFDAKRDRWNGYNPNEHKKLMEEWELVEEERKRIKSIRLDKEFQLKAGSSATLAAEADKTKQDGSILSDVDTSSGEDDDEDKYAEGADMAGQKHDLKSRQTVRNLRIREDVPKYLRNLDIESAHYDPKTRSMRDNPCKDKGLDELDYAGDNFHRFTGDAVKMKETMTFAWQAAERGNDVHLQANPSQAEFLYREYVSKKDGVRQRQKAKIIAQYGGEDHLKRPPGLPQQTEEYVEYSRTGRIIRGAEKSLIRSKYMEDVHPQNHSAVWGSFWRDGEWGYACCHGTLYNSFCTGLAGKEAQRDAFDAAVAMAAGAAATTRPLVS